MVQERTTMIDETCKRLIGKMKEAYMSGEDMEKLMIISSNLLSHLNTNDQDAMKQLLLAHQSDYVYDTINYPFFSDEDEYIMNALENIINHCYGKNQQLDESHWIFADGKYKHLFH